MGRFTGKVVSIVGAAGEDNMGQVMARRFAAEGAKVVVSGRHEAALSKLAEEIDGDWVLCDFSKKASINTMIDSIIERHGKLDVAINSTGWGLLVPLEENSEEQLDQMLDLQFKGPFVWLQKLIQVMADTGGSIIQISSATANIMLDDHAAYMCTKAGTDHLIRCVANQYGPKGIRANVVLPGTIETPVWQTRKDSRPDVFELVKSWSLFYSSWKNIPQPWP